jgi:hypothetical protein|tara:strand:+ start:227 stop:487 length:261 start_codon:yes stop_codon:yes gene_type:complete
MTNSLTNDSRRGRCRAELSFLKAHRETYLNLEPVDGDNSFVIIEQYVQLQDDSSNEERFLYLEESRSQESCDSKNMNWFEGEVEEK